MTPSTLLEHCDSGRLWPAAPSDDPAFDVAAAYRQSLAVRELRIARGELPRGFKIGFTNRNIWPRYQVYAPIWGTVWNTTVSDCEDQGSVCLAGSCQPRIEPETVFGMLVRPPQDASLQQLFDAIDWVAPGFEIVQSHLPDWKFKSADTVADGGLHSRLLVGRQLPVRQIAKSADELDARLAAAQVTLRHGEQIIDQGYGANVLDSPLRALHHFLRELRHCPGAPDLAAGDIVTTGTWTDAWPVQPGQRWHAAFSAPLQPLSVEFT
ncbi:MAG: 2-keto-4-pentenoate hydratase [Rhodoferax sp.]